jgi:hypothetical protein
MDGQTQISSPTFPNNPADSSLASRSSQYTPLRPDHAGSVEPGNDGYDSHRSPSGSTPMNESGNAKRRKVNHGMFLEIGVSEDFR